MKTYLYVFFVVLATVAEAAPNANSEKTTANNVCKTEGCKKAAKKILNYMDSSVDPCDNFYKFACGGFHKSTPIPPDQLAITSYSSLRDDLQAKLKILFEEEDQPNQIKLFSLLKQFYRSCMDTKKIERHGLEPMHAILKQLGGWPVLEGEKWKGDTFEWTKLTSQLHDLGLFYFGFLWFGVDDHPKNATLGMIMVTQAKFGISRELLSQGLSNPSVQAYFKFMRNIAVIFGANSDIAQKELLEALNLEISIAKISSSSEKLRDVNALYNPTTLNEMQIKYPSINWVELANNLNGYTGQVIDGTEEVLVELPDYVTNLVSLLKQTPSRVQANYIIWRAIKDVIPYLTEKVLDELLEFEKQRYGIKQLQQRWQQCVSITSDSMPILSGAMYVRKYFSSEARAKAKEIILGVKKAFTKILDGVDWMDSETKAHALQKVENMLIYLGYSDELLDNKKLEDYHALWQPRSDIFLQLELDNAIFRIQKYSERLREVMHRSDWKGLASPIVLDAFSYKNIIEFPAGVLQEVYFDETRPRYINYAGIGFLAGHVITHGFDDVGRRYDKNGDLVDWWNKKTDEAFLKRAQCIVNQYNNYTVPEIGLQLDGARTQGENIADNGAAKESYLAYQDWTQQNSPEPSLPGLNYTANQLFWLSAANIWCANYSPEYLRDRVLTGVHSPNEFRVLGSFQNVQYFSNDFNCPSGSFMNPVKKCILW